MKVIYRISDGGNNKQRPSFFDKKAFFLHFLKRFKAYDIYVIADNVSEDTYSFLQTHIDSVKIIRTNLHNAKSFLFAVDFAISNFELYEKVYFAEDDYLYTEDAADIIKEGLDISNYVSGYDHPDKYMNYDEGGPNPYIKEGGELTRVVMTKNKHWKFTNSCCMTFGTRVSTLEMDKDVYIKYCNGNNIGDFGIFCELIQSRQRKLISPIPSVSTHVETLFLARLINWEKQLSI
jgi:hypothetical protein